MDRELGVLYVVCMGIGWAENLPSTAGVDSFAGRTGVVVPTAGDYPASSITATGALGSTVQQQLDALLAATLTDTVLAVDPFTITAGGTWNTLVPLPIANASTRHFFAVVEFSAGLSTAPQAASIQLKGVAVCNAAGAVTASSLSITSDNLALAGIQARFDAGVGVVNLQFRKAGSAQVTRAVMRYGWRESLIP